MNARARNSMAATLAILSLLTMSPPLFARAACTAPPALAKEVKTRPTAENLQSLGAWFADRKQFLCAAKAFGSASDINPTSSSLAYLWALSLSSAGDSSAALEQFRRAASLDSNDIRPHLASAAIFDRLKRTADAEIEWRKALVIDPESATALDGLSKDFINQKDYPAVIALLTKNSSDGQLSSVQSVNLGIAFAATARPEDAIHVLRKGLNKDPESLPLADELAVVLMLTDQDQEAYKVFETAIHKHPEDQATKVLYLHTLVNNDAERAPAYARQLLVDYPHQWEVLYLNGLIVYRNGQDIMARDLLEKSISINPNYGPSRTALGKVLARLGDAQSAERQLEKGIALGEDTTESEYSLAMVLKGLGETNAARERLSRVKQLESMESYKVQASTAARVGDQSMARGDFSQAAGIYRNALSIEPEDPALHYKLSRALAKVNDIAGETTELERAVQLDPKLAEAQNQLGYLTVRSGDAQRAEMYFHAAIRAQPSYVTAWINLAATLASEAKWNEAEKAVSRALELDPGNTAAQRLKKDILLSHP